MDKALVQTIKSRHWYLQGLEGYPLFITLPLAACTSALKNKIGVSYGTTMVYCKDNLCEIFFDKEQMKKISKLILHQKLRDQNFFHHLDAHWNLEEFYNVITKTNTLSSLSDQELQQFSEQLMAMFIDKWADFLFIDAFDPCWEELLHGEIKKYNRRFTEEEIKILTSPTKRSFLQEERLQLLRIIQKHKLDILEGNDQIKELIAHQQQYFWYMDNYGNCQFLDYDYFLHKAQELCQHDVEEDIQQLELFPQYQTNARDKILKNVPEGLKRAFDLFSELGYYRDKRKSFMLKGNAALYKVMQEYGKRTTIPVDLLCHLTCFELSRVAEKPSVLRKKLEKRQHQGILVVTQEEREPFIVEKEAQALRNKILEKSGLQENVTEIKGTPACLGKVTGTVKVIDRINQFSKMNEGDILVSKMTRPEFLPVMKKAAAIVTDEGGITCHAAIVAREMKKPCIIGTQIATHVLKDGDMVEVDAHKGIVRKQIVLEKNYTRDTTLVLQQIWLGTMVKSAKKYLGLDLSFPLVGVDYLHDGAIEIWENAQAIQLIKDAIVRQCKNNPSSITKILKRYEGELKNFQAIWQKGVILHRQDLLTFIEAIDQEMFGDLLHCYIAEEERVSGKIKSIASKLRQEDHFFASNDLILRHSIAAIYPEIAQYPTCILLEEVREDKIPSLKECQQRFHHFVVDSAGYHTIEAIEEYVQHRPVKLVVNTVDTSQMLSGQIASPGKVKGKVKLLRRNNEIADVKEGDIIVSPMTTPTFMPALQKATAFVTDEGGLVCHAAIVARELKKPCIVGTKIATQILKDGDFVEVDAEKGIVRKISR